MRNIINVWIIIMLNIINMRKMINYQYVRQKKEAKIIQILKFIFKNHLHMFIYKMTFCGNLLQSRFLKVFLFQNYHNMNMNE